MYRKINEQNIKVAVDRNDGVYKIINIATFACIIIHLCLTCHLSIVLLQFMDLAPLTPIFLVDVDLVVIRAQGNL